MVEIFQTILQYPLQFLAGLGISGGAIYGAFSFSKWLISLFTKKSQKAKEILNRQAIADTIINAVGGIDNFIDKIAEKVIEKFTTNKTIDEFKQVLQKISSKNDCPIELKAYIETVLSQSGSEQPRGTFASWYVCYHHSRFGQSNRHHRALFDSAEIDRCQRPLCIYQQQRICSARQRGDGTTLRRRG